MERKRKLQWIYAITSVVAMGVTRDLVEKYGNGIRVDMGIIALIAMAGVIIYMFIIGEKSQYKVIYIMIIFFLIMALMVYSMYLDNLILAAISFNLLIITCLLIPKIVKSIKK